MKVTAAFLARYATIDQDGTLNVLGGAMSWIGRPTFPAPMQVSMVVLLEISDTDVDCEVDLRLEIRPIDTVNNLAIAGALGKFTPTLNKGLRDTYGVQIPVLIDLTNVQVPNAGQFSIDFAIGDAHGQAGFIVIQGSDISLSS